jgi:acetyl-CoA carboxylase biotin carboxylase subunit
MDEGVYEGWTVPNDYDPLLSKLIAWGNSREETIARLRGALDEYIITGIRTNAGLFRRILTEPEFLRGEIHTRWLDEVLRRSRTASSGSEDTELNAACEASAIAAAIWQANQSSAQASTASCTNETSSRWKMEGRRQQLDRMP